jgi:hypothetical protein
MALGLHGFCCWVLKYLAGGAEFPGVTWLCPWHPRNKQEQHWRRNREGVTICGTGYQEGQQAVAEIWVPSTGHTVRHFNALLRYGGCAVRTT